MIPGSVHNELPIGYRLESFQIEAVLGQGGFGVTYLAYDSGLHRPVAIKEFLPSELAVRTSDSSVHPITEQHMDTFSWGLQRFLSEARTLAQFKHPNIVSVFSVFEANGTAYMVMEYERGASLEGAIRRGQMRDEASALTMMHPLLGGLAQVHRAGFIHRDIKPDNIFLREDGVPVLLDFGSARQALGGETRTLTSLITPGYAPFEQYNSTPENDRQGPWTDIYSLGATLHRVIVGRGPIEAVTRADYLLAGEPDPFEPLEARRFPGWSANTCEAVNTALQFRSSDRPQSVVEWSAMLPSPPSGSTAGYGDARPTELTGGRAGTSTAVTENQPPELADEPPTTPPTEATGPSDPGTTVIVPQSAAGGGHRPLPNELAAESPQSVPDTRIQGEIRQGLPVWMVVVAVLTIGLGAAVGTWWYLEGSVPVVATGRDLAANIGSSSTSEVGVPGEGSVSATNRSVDGARQAAAGPPAVKRESADLQAGEQQVTEQQAAEQRAAEQRAAEQRAAEQRAAEQRAAEQRAAEQRAAEQRTAEQRAAEQRAAEQQAAEQRAAEQRAAEQRAAEQRAAEQRAAEQRAAEQRAAEQRAADQQAAEQRAAEQRAADQQAAEQRAADQHAEEQRAADALRRQELEELIAKANSDLQARRLTTPRGNNAYERFSEVLELDPGNEAAASGLERIVDQYLRLAEKATIDGRFDSATRFLDRAATVIPGHSGVAAASADNKARREAADAQEAKAAAKAKSDLRVQNNAQRADGQPTTPVAGSTAAPSAAESSAPTTAPKVRRYAIFPFHSVVNCYINVEREIVDQLTSSVRRAGGGINYSYYRSKGSVDRNRVWSGSNRPQLNALDAAARRLNVDVVLTAYIGCSDNESVTADSYRARVFLWDRASNRLYDRQRGLFHIDAATDNLIGRAGLAAR